MEGREGKESEEGKQGRMVARERSHNHSLPGPLRGHKDRLVSLSPSAELQVVGEGRLGDWCSSNLRSG